MKDYIISSGYSQNKEKAIAKYEFFDIWYKNTMKYTNPKKIVILNSGEEKVPNNYNNIEWINLFTNPGHEYHLRYKWNNPPALTGWTHSILFGALYAYANNCDFFYKEQDCLAFGDYINICQSSNCKMMFGRLKENDTPEEAPIEQSLIYIKRNYILKFITEYLSIEKTDGEIDPENKFLIIKQNNKKDIEYLPFGYGRARPVNLSDNTFYVQRLNTHSPLLKLMKVKKLI